VERRWLRSKSQHCRERLRSRSQHRRELSNKEVVAEIQTIFGGFAGGDESNSARKAYARRVKNPEVYMIERPLKLRKKESMVIGFLDDDYEGVYWPHSNALVVC
jgi:hypothetical protein